MNQYTPDTLTIQLTRGCRAIIDSVDADLLQFKWRASVGKTNSYAERAIRINGKRSSQSMHRVILSRILGRALGSGEFTDHIDGNGLNNTRANLRLATAAQNQHNTRKHKSASSAYKGVSYAKNNDAWRASISHGINRKVIGYYETEVEAAIAYNREADRLFGEFAHLNDIPDWRERPIRKREWKDVGKSGYPGVQWNNKAQMWMVQVGANKQKFYGGMYTDLQDAISACIELRVRLGIKARHAA